MTQLQLDHGLTTPCLPANDANAQSPHKLILTRSVRTTIDLTLRVRVVSAIVDLTLRVRIDANPRGRPRRSRAAAGWNQKRQPAAGLRGHLQPAERAIVIRINLPERHRDARAAQRLLPGPQRGLR